MEEQQKSMLEFLLDPVESDRVLAMADLLFQAETYARAVHQAMSNLGGKLLHDDEAYRDFYAVQTMAKEVITWLAGHNQALYQYVISRKSGATDAVSEAAHVEPGQTFH